MKSSAKNKLYYRPNNNKSEPTIIAIETGEKIDLFSRAKSELKLNELPNGLAGAGCPKLEPKTRTFRLLALYTDSVAGWKKGGKSARQMVN